jgi:CheY-like chemotaxis protein
MDKHAAGLDEKPILIIDDDEELRRSMVDLLGELGFAAEAVADGERGLERLTRGPAPWLILLDLKMPVMDGPAFRAAQRRSAALIAIPVVLVTADADVEERAIALGVEAYLRKPVGLRELEPLLRQLERRRETQTARTLV